MMASALKEAKNVLLDNTSILTDNKTFLNILALLDDAVTAEQAEGMSRLVASKSPWLDD